MQEDYEVGVCNRFDVLLDEDAMSQIEQVPTSKKTRKGILILSDGKCNIKLAKIPKKLRASSKPDASFKENSLVHISTEQDGLQTNSTEPYEGSVSKQPGEIEAKYKQRDFKSSKKVETNPKERHADYKCNEHENTADAEVECTTENPKKNLGFQGRGNYNGRRGRTFYGRRGDNHPYYDKSNQNDGIENYQHDKVYSSFRGRYQPRSNSRSFNTNNQDEENDEREDNDVKKEQQFGRNPRGSQSHYYKSEYHGGYSNQYSDENYVNKYDYKREGDGLKEEYRPYGKYQKGGQNYYGQSYGNNKYKKEGYAGRKYTNPDVIVEEVDEVGRENFGNYKPAYNENNINLSQHKTDEGEGGSNERYQAYGRYQRGKARGYSSYRGNKNYQQHYGKDWKYEDGEYGGYQREKGGYYKPNYRGSGNKGGYYNSCPAYSQNDADFKRENMEVAEVKDEQVDEQDEEHLESTESHDVAAEQFEPSINQDIDEHRPGAWYLEVLNEEANEKLTLAEYRELNGKREKPVFNVRQAGEGEDTEQWQSMYALENKKNQHDNTDEEDSQLIDIHQTYPQRAGRQKQLLDINIRFSDSRRGRRGRGRGGRGGRGRGFHQDSAIPKEYNRIEWCEPSQMYNQQSCINPNTCDGDVEICSDWTPQKSTFYSGNYKDEAEKWPGLRVRNEEHKYSHQSMNQRGGNEPFADHRGFKKPAAPKVDDEKDFPPLC